jgi:hypothetical protein
MLDDALVEHVDVVASPNGLVLQNKLVLDDAEAMIMQIAQPLAEVGVEGVGEGHGA